MSNQEQSPKTQYKVKDTMHMKNLHTLAMPNAELFNADARLINSFGGKVDLTGIDSPYLDLKEYYSKLNNMINAVNRALQEPNLELSESIKYNNMKTEITRMKAEISLNVWTMREKDKMISTTRRLGNIDMVARMEMEDELKGR